MRAEPFDPGASFRKASITDRRRLVREYLGGDPDLLGGADPQSDYLDLADTLSENTFGVMALPLGLCRGIVINDQIHCAVMATEEPSVIAAANYGCRVIAAGGGFRVETTGSQMGVQIFLSEEKNPDYWYSWFIEHRPGLEELFSRSSASMEARGGGFRELVFEPLPDGRYAKLTAYIDVCDAMGANILNSCGEKASAWIEDQSGMAPIMAILTNNAERRLARASFRLPLNRLPAAGDRGLTRGERARRIVSAAEIAAQDRDRAVTHNKGIMNAITALALATANDTRGVEAAVHAFASRSGRYRPLSTYKIESTPGGDELIGEFAAPLPLASVGGAVGFHHTARAALHLMGDPGAAELAGLAAALGLAQNFAALLALTGAGIQQGHMRLHARRIAFAAGFRGDAIERAAEKLHAAGSYSNEAARSLFAAEEE